MHYGISFRMTNPKDLEQDKLDAKYQMHAERFDFVVTAPDGTVMRFWHHDDIIMQKGHYWEEEFVDMTQLYQQLFKRDGVVPTGNYLVQVFLDR